ncbi:hypothetical protein BGK72_39070 [Streptomyces agglomeratus]|nr:hypothetical protein BGK72_39070 [Streptomyces agglomeratus]
MNQTHGGPHSAGGQKPAWLDESFHENSESGFYILAATIIDPTVTDDVRAAIRALKGRRDTSKSHWTEMDHRQRRHAAQLVAVQSGLHVVAVGTPVPKRRQERARSKSLTALVVELHGFEVDQLYIESREAALNKDDISTVARARQTVLPKGTVFRADHVHGRAEPLLWISDIVAGAVHAQRKGDPQYTAMLGDALLDFEVPTDC